MIRPRIFWRYYPKSRRGYWCVSPTPLPASPQVRQLWRYAHEMKGQMNAAPLTTTQAAELRDRFNEAHPHVKQFWDETPSSDYIAELKARTDGMSAGDFKLLYMQEPFPDADDAREEARAGQRKRLTGRRDDLDLSERASRDPNDPRGRLK